MLKIFQQYVTVILNTQNTARYDLTYIVLSFTIKYILYDEVLVHTCNQVCG